MTRPVTPEDIETMRAMRAAGLKQAEIAKRTGRGLRTVERYTTRCPAPGAMPVSEAEIAEMEALARRGLSWSQIGARVGREWHTVGRYVGHLVSSRAGFAPDMGRWRRMVAAAETAERGGRHDIARRFDLANAKSLRTALVRARKRLAEAERKAA